MPYTKIYTVIRYLIHCVFFQCIQCTLLHFGVFWSIIICMSIFAVSLKIEQNFQDIQYLARDKKFSVLEILQLTYFFFFLDLMGILSAKFLCQLQVLTVNPRMQCSGLVYRVANFRIRTRKVDLLNRFLQITLAD